MENWNHQTLLSRIVKWCNCFGKQSVISQAFLSIELLDDPVIPLLKKISQTNENIFTQKACIEVYSSIIHTAARKVETSKWMSKSTKYAISINKILFSHKKGWSSDTCHTWINLENITISCKPVTKKTIYYGSQFHMGVWGLITKGYSVAFEVMKMF